MAGALWPKGRPKYWKLSNCSKAWCVHVHMVCVLFILLYYIILYYIILYYIIILCYYIILLYLCVITSEHNFCLGYADLHV